MRWRTLAAGVLALLAGLTPFLMVLLEFGPHRRLDELGDRPEALVALLLPLLISTALALGAGALLKAEFSPSLQDLLKKLFPPERHA